MSNLSRRLFYVLWEVSERILYLFISSITAKDGEIAHFKEILWAKDTEIADLKENLQSYLSRIDKKRRLILQSN